MKRLPKKPFFAQKTANFQLVKSEKKLTFAVRQASVGPRERIVLMASFSPALPPPWRFLFRTGTAF